MKKVLNNQLNNNDVNRNIILNIDYRESKIIKYFQECNKEDSSIVYSIHNLPIGDFIFKNSDDIIYIIERKSIQDLSSSIIDGRFREQKQRLLDSIQYPEKIIYIIEGQYTYDQAISKSTLNSSILNLMFKHKYNVIQTSNDLETYEILIMLYNKIINNEFEMCKDKNISVNKLIKKSDIINDNILIHMLSVIPGISVNIAKKISEHYKSLPELIIKYNSLSTQSDKEKMLSDIKVTNKRKLGAVLSTKIYNSLYLEKSKELEKSIECLID